MLNRDIATALTRLGHTDTVIIADCGLPIPESTPCIDVSLSVGDPKLTAVLEAVVNDMEIDGITLANEIKRNNQTVHGEIKETYKEIPINYISHEELKNRLKEAKAVIRTGEATPYANVILQAGVIF